MWKWILNWVIVICCEDTIDKDRGESAGVWMDDAEGFSFDELHC